MRTLIYRCEFIKTIEREDYEVFKVMGHFYGWKRSREFLFVLISDEPTKPTLYPFIPPCFVYFSVAFCTAKKQER